MATKKAVAKQDTNMVLDERPDWSDPQKNRGSETVGIDDLTIPRIDVIQDLSKQRKKNDPMYIDGADTGMIFNSVSEVLYGTEVEIVPVVFRKEYVIWRDRDSGGGFRGAFSTEEEAKSALAKLEDGDMCEINPTGQHFVLVLHEGEVEQAVVSMSKSKLKASRKLNSLVRQVGGDRFSAVYTLKAVEASGPKGDYINFDVRYRGFCSEELYRAGEEMYEAVMSGAKDVDRTDMDATEEKVEAEEF